MPIVESRKEYVVDWNTMTQIGLSKESILINIVLSIFRLVINTLCCGNFSRIVHSYTNYSFRFSLVAIPSGTDEEKAGSL